MASAFESAAAQKQIEYMIEIPQKPKGLSYDREKLETIVNNLLGNAFKFTPDGGRVSLQCSVSSRESMQDKVGSMQSKNQQLPTANSLLLTVTDSGPGISKEKLTQVFDRFYQSDDTATRNFEGSGIGLALSKELVELHGGTISVKSDVGKGTTFWVELPLAQADWQGSPAVFSQPNQRPETKTAQSNTPTASADAPTLLLVEDNEDLRQYLRNSLEGSYKILEASNGQIGLNIAREHIPDLIISDVMMPVMDGFTFCEAAKTDIRTSHIPVILLTALADRDHRIEGLETGADDYLAKPFDAQELRVRVANLIDQRLKLREKFQRQSPLSPKDIAVTSADERFLEKVNEVLERNYAASEFSIEAFAAEMAMSRMQLLRKIKALTGEKPSELLKNFRLQRAAQLLRNGHASVSEVGYLVGFSTPAHFSKSFKALYDVSPSEYGK
jgi:DNA-binding response OmpR family regulator